MDLLSVAVVLAYFGSSVGTAFVARHWLDEGGCDAPARLAGFVVGLFLMPAVLPFLVIVHLLGGRS